MLFFNEISCKMYLKHEKNLLITVCRRALRSLVLRTQIGSFRSCSIRKKAAARSREIRKKSPKIPLESGD